MGGKGKGRPVSNETKLGRLANADNRPIYKLSAECEVSSRLLTEYTAGRRRIPTHTLIKMAEYFGVEVEDVMEDEDIELQNKVTLNPATTAYEAKEKLRLQMQTQMGRKK